MQFLIRILVVYVLTLYVYAHDDSDVDLVCEYVVIVQILSYREQLLVCLSIKAI